MKNEDLVVRFTNFVDQLRFFSSFVRGLNQASVRKNSKMVAVKFTCKIVINICITAKPLVRVICIYQQTRRASAGDTTGEAYTHENNFFILLYEL